MPSSHYYQLNEIIDLISLADPGKMLDIGPGFGKYGFLAREYLELWNEGGEYGKWKRQIDCIEAFVPYITPVHKFIYNNVYIGNALEILPGLPGKYDLVLMIDVFEHFTHEDGLRMLEECRKKGRNVLISVPRVMSPQEAVFGNEFETHKYGWTREDFRNITGKFFLNNSKSTICFIGEDSSRIVKLLRERKTRERFVAIFDFLYLKKAVRFLMGRTG